MAEEAKKNKDNNKILAVIIILIVAGAVLFLMSLNKSQMNTAGVGNSVTQAPKDSNSSASSSELTSKKWTWVQSNMTNNITTTPSKEDAFTATFQTDGRLVLGTDCNSGNAGYTLGADNSLTISPIASTMMYCEGSAETAYFKQIQTAKGYKIENGQLNISLEGDTGTMIFK